MTTKEFAERVFLIDEPSMWYGIWSIEHAAWWAPDELGYTTDILQAGFYQQAHAQRIIEQSNQQQVMEVAIPVRMLMRVER